MFKVNIGYLYGYKYWIHISIYCNMALQMNIVDILGLKIQLLYKLFVIPKKNIFQLDKDSYYFSFIHIHVPKLE